MRSVGVVAIAVATVLVLAPAARSSGFHPAMASFVSNTNPIRRSTSSPQGVSA